MTKAKIDCAYTDIVELSKLKEHPKNPNKHDKAQVNRLAKIIDFQGQRHPIVVSSRSGFIVAGHGRKRAMKQLGWKECAVDYQDFETDEQEYAFIVGDNASALWAELDLPAIKATITSDEFKAMDLDFLAIKDLNFEGVPDMEVQTEKPAGKRKKGEVCPTCGK